jgi:hypothetical protein
VDGLNDRVKWSCESSVNLNETRVQGRIQLKKLVMAQISTGSRELRAQSLKWAKIYLWETRDQADIIPYHCLATALPVFQTHWVILANEQLRRLTSGAKTFRFRQSSSNLFQPGCVIHRIPNGSWIQTLGNVLASKMPSHGFGTTGGCIANKLTLIDFSPSYTRIHVHCLQHCKLDFK